MATFSSTNIVKSSITTKSYLITRDELEDIDNNAPIVGYEPLRTLSTDDESIINFRFDNTSSPKILNWVEPYEILGVNKTLFYTEVNTGFKVGDKVFIINGTYDSNELIKTNKYKRGRDGYKVLFIDKCRIVLDIDFTGLLPASETEENKDDFDEYIKVYYIKDRNDFIHVNRQLSTRNGVISNKFSSNQNNIVFSDSNSGFLAVSGWGENSGLFYSGTSSSGFFIKNGTNTWTDITNDFNIGDITTASTPLSNNGKIIIQNGSFEYNGVLFKEDTVYKWTGDNWEVDVKSVDNNVPIITKSNFRGGKFNGVWNGGVFGSNDKRIVWDSKTSSWNSGTLLNSVWKEGIMESIYTQRESFFAEFDRDGIPYQRSNNPDNNGYGYNFIINSEIENAIINNGNVNNTRFGTQSSATYSIVEEHLKGTLTQTVLDERFDKNIVKKALFDNCRFINANIENGEVRNSRSINTRFNNVKSINTRYKESLFLNSSYISNDSIRILNYDEFRYENNGISYMVYKFYINKRSYERFKFKDVFYIRGIKIKDFDNRNVLNFFDKKFKIGPWVEYSDEYNTVNNSFYKRGFEYSGFVSTPKENEYKFSNNTIFGLNENGYSIDIFVSTKDINGNITTPNIFFNKLDFTDAYIISSDFESGVFESSNWNSGRHINYNSDSNITKDGNKGLYDMVISGTNSLIVGLERSSTTSVGETEEDYLEVGDVVFLNAVDYDTRGKVTSISVKNTGSGYSSGGLFTIGGTGSGLQLDVIAGTVGHVTGITYSTPTGTGYVSGFLSNVSTTGGGDNLLTVDVNVTLGQIDDIKINNAGSSYINNSIITIDGGDNNATFSITSTYIGEILSTSIISEGLGYSKGDVLTINGGNNNATIEVISTTGSLTRLPDSYKVIGIEDTTLIETIRKDIDIAVIGTQSFNDLLPNGIFSTNNANNRYGYLHKTKFKKSRIISGLFRRSFFDECLIKNNSYDISDRDFTNIERIKTLVISDVLFSNKGNIMSNSLYMNSNFVGGSDIWDNGILYNSVWNGMTFSNGLLKESTWINGIFSNGLFYNSRTFDNNGVGYTENNIRKYYKSGVLNINGFNDRHSWQNGVFLDGEFYKSDWENGIFNNGKFYYSKYYSGTFNGGRIGDKSVPVYNTLVYNAKINYAEVENSTIVAATFSGVTVSSIQWNDGIFNSGIFGTDTRSLLNTATWSNGIFNNGDFVTNAKWENGIFNGGKFTSGYAWERDNSTDKKDYSWENGIFNGGEFGNASGSTNSTWFDGEFNGGQFKGRVWNNGVFLYGDFIGSATHSPIGGLSSSNAQVFVNSYNNNYYGLWRNGIVTDVKDKYVTDRKLFTDIKRSSDTRTTFNIANMNNVLWLNGVFTHPTGNMNNSVWLDGVFERGKFSNSSFNPYVTRVATINPSFNKRVENGSKTCRWVNGTFEGGDFNYSDWENGNFISGTAIGMIWKNGISNYMNAYNIYWENGIWRNGNWYGSNFELNKDGSIKDDYTKQIMFRGMEWSGTSSCHIWNIFQKEGLTTDNIGVNTVASPILHNPNNVADKPPTPPTEFTFNV